MLKGCSLHLAELSLFFLQTYDKLFPAIYLHWKKYLATVLEKLKAMGKSLIMSGDGRHDSMGHSAKFGAYTIFCCSLPLVIHFADQPVFGSDFVIPIYCLYIF